MANFKLRPDKGNENHLRICRTELMSDSYAEENWELFLRDEVTREHIYDVKFRYHLFAMKPHSEDMALAYEIDCPKCGNRLKKISAIRNHYNLGTYVCPVCNRK